jgi:hypothetical protein
MDKEFNFVKENKDAIQCYAYPGFTVWVTKDDCKNCEIGSKGCPGYFE